MNLEQVLPADIEKRGFETITEELGSRVLDPENEVVIKRAIHTTADFDCADSLTFSPHAMTKGLGALRLGTPIITDTNMGKARINKTTPRRTGSEIYCFMTDENMAKTAREVGTTRATASMGKTAALSSQGKDCIFTTGNAPTALIHIKELVDQGKFHPKLIITVPVSFVNVVQAKELILDLDILYIVTGGREGDSDMAAAIYSTLLYQLYI